MSTITRRRTGITTVTSRFAIRFRWLAKLIRQLCLFSFQHPLKTKLRTTVALFSQRRHTVDVTDRVNVRVIVIIARHNGVFFAHKNMKLLMEEVPKSPARRSTGLRHFFRETP